jgi:type I restriction enzyme S subunit
MSRWPVVPLKQILERISRPEAVLAHETYNILGAHWYAKGLYIKSVLSGIEIRANKVYRVEKGDFVYNRLFGWKGSFAVASEKHHNCYVSNEFPCFLIDTQQLDRNFLWYYFSRESVWEKALGLSTGSTSTSRNRLKEKMLLAMKIPLPSLDEQRRIVARIEALAAKVEQAQSLRQKSAAEVDSFVTSLHLNLSETSVPPLGEILVLDEQREKIEIEKSYPQIGIKGFGQGLFPKPAIDGTQTTYKWFNHLYEGAVVLSQVKGWEGAIGVCPPSLVGYYASPEYRTFRCIDGKALPEYLAEIITTPWFWNQLKTVQRGLGGRRQRTRPEQFLQMEVPMPTVEKQKQAILTLKKLKPVKRHQAATAGQLEALLPSILDRAFRGEF